MRHLLSIEDLDRTAIERILDRAKSFTEVSEREIKKVPALRGRRVLNLFYEASTRTRSSFELAAKALSADVINFAAGGSSVEKGESLKDTVQTLSAYQPDLIVIRTPHVGAAKLVAEWTTAARRQRRRRQARAPDPGAAGRLHPARAARRARRPQHLDRRRRHAQPRGALEHPRLPEDGCEGHALRTADADPARHRGARVRGRLHARRARLRRRGLRAADAEGAHDRLVRPEHPRVRRPVPDPRPPARRPPGAHAPGPGQPRRRARRRGDRLSAGRDRPAGGRRRRRPDGGALRAAGGPHRAGPRAPLPVGAGA